MDNMKKALNYSLLIFISIFTLFAPGLSAASGQSESKSTSASTELTTAKQVQQYAYLVQEIMNYVLNNYVDEVKPELLYKGAMEGILNALDDKHTSYMDVSGQRNLNDITDGQFGGVGLSITKATVSTAANPAYVNVSSPIEGTPGWRAGIQSGDELIMIDGVDTSTITMDDVLSLLRGTPGTTVNVTVRRNSSMEFNVTLERALIDVPAVKYGFIEGTKTGYLSLIEFTALLPERTKEALNFFSDNGYDSLIIDLRNNPGGLLSAAVEVADMFLDSGVIVSSAGRTNYADSVYNAYSWDTIVPKDLPIVVLIDGNSASASEILSGALKDYHRAYLVGENTYGKGSVQVSLSLPYNDGAKVTIARYYSPTGANIDKVGIPPDMEVLFGTMTEEEQTAYVDLMNADEINLYVKEHPEMTEAEIAAYADELYSRYPMGRHLLRRMIRIAVQKKTGDALYDLDYDVQLKAAIEVLGRPDFADLVANTKTLKEIQELKAADTESAAEK